MTLSVETCIRLACVASVSNRVIARTLERKQKKVEGGGEKREGSFVPLPLPRHSFFFLLLSCPSFLYEPREETLATQASIRRTSCIKRTLQHSPRVSA